MGGVGEGRGSCSSKVTLLQMEAIQNHQQPPPQVPRWIPTFTGSLSHPALASLFSLFPLYLEEWDCDPSWLLSEF